MTDHDQHNTQGVPGENADADTASGGAPEPPDTADAERHARPQTHWRMTMQKPYILTAVIGLAAAAVAYVIGTKAGASRFRELSGIAKDVWNDPAVAKVRDRAFRKIESTATHVAGKA
jgi:hypothetical protein